MSATHESVAVAPSSVNTRCRVDLSASGGDCDKRGSPAVARVVVTVLALILVVIIVVAGGGRGSCDDNRRGIVGTSGRVGDPGTHSGDIDLLRICSWEMMSARLLGGDTEQKRCGLPWFRLRLRR